MKEHRAIMRPADFQRVLDAYARLVLAGTVNSGKSLLLEHTKPGREVIHTDNLRGRLEVGWVEQAILERLRGVPRFVLTGMLAPRALGAGLEVDAVVWLERTRPGEHGGPSARLRGMAESWETAHPEAMLFVVDRALRDEEEL